MMCPPEKIKVGFKVGGTLVLDDVPTPLPPRKVKVEFKVRATLGDVPLAQRNSRLE